MMQFYSESDPTPTPSKPNVRTSRRSSAHPVIRGVGLALTAVLAAGFSSGCAAQDEKYRGGQTALTVPAGSSVYPNNYGVIACGKTTTEVTAVPTGEADAKNALGHRYTQRFIFPTGALALNAGNDCPTQGFIDAEQLVPVIPSPSPSVPLPSSPHPTGHR